MSAFFKTLIFILLGCLLMPSIPVRAQDVRTSLDTIPHREQELLDNLFTFFVKWDQLGHVIFFGTKPVCFTGIPENINYSVTPSCISKDPLKFQEELFQSWNVWKKYEHLFPHPNFVICAETRQFGKGEKKGTMIDVFFIHKRGLLSCLNKYQALFREELGEDFSPENFLKEVEEKKILRPLINHDEMLLGVLLGFGQEAPRAFREERRGHPVEMPMRQVGRLLKGCKFSPIAYKGDPSSEESQALMETYSEELSTIWEAYQGKNLLEFTLEKLCETGFVD